MKQPSCTVPPLMGPDASKKFSLRRFLLGDMASGTYYEAHREDNGVYILWMEFSRFGRLLAYPCVLQEREGRTLVFRSGGAEENDALLERWNELVTPDTFPRFRCTPLKKDDFRRIFAAYRTGQA